MRPEGAPYCFVLDEGQGDAVRAIVDIGPRWMELPHAASRSRGFILLPGEELRTGEFEVAASHCIHLEAMRGAPVVSHDGLDLELSFLVEDDSPLSLATLHVGNEQDPVYPLSRCLDLRAHAGRRGRLVLRCLPGSAGDPDGDWAAILAWCVAPADQLGLARARSQYAWRLANESARFLDTYRDPLYDSGTSPTAPGPEGNRQSIEALAGGGGNIGLVAAESFLPALQQPALQGESAFAYASRLLATLAPPRIDFADRLQMLARDGRRPRLLSLCAGEARIEAELATRSGATFDMTMVELSPDLLRRAAGRFPEKVGLRLLQGRVEDFAPQGAGFDVVMFVSGLHHVVELESVLARCAMALAPGGELWLVGEQVGPPGNRLPADAREVAEPLFGGLPERLRRNLEHGRVDVVLPDFDFSSSCFEGIRSDEIPQALARHFSPVVEDRRNCFLWRFIDLAYAGNYDLSRDEDQAVLRALVAAEYAFYANGGLGCELNGVYRGKLG